MALPPVLAPLTSLSPTTGAEHSILKHANHSNSTMRLVPHELVGRLQPCPHAWAVPDALLLGAQPVALPSVVPPQLAKLELGPPSRLARPVPVRLQPIATGLAATQCSELLQNPMDLLLKVVEADPPTSHIPGTNGLDVPADLGQPPLPLPTPNPPMAMTRLGSLEPLVSLTE